MNGDGTMFRNKAGQIRSGWKILIVMVVIFAMLQASFLIFDRLVTLYIRATALGSQEIMAEKWSAIYDLWFIPLFIVQEIIMIAVPIFMWKVIGKRSLADMGLSSIKKHEKELAMGLLLGIVSITLVFIILVSTGNAKVASWRPVFSVDTITYLVLFIMVGIAEEVLGRGYVMSVLRQTKSMPVIVGASGAIFSLIHMGNSGFDMLPFINIFLVGMLFAYMYLKSGNIWMPIGYHITWNYFQGNVYGFLVSGLETQGIITTKLSKHNLINGGAFGPEGGLAVTAIILMGFIFVKGYYQRKRFSFLEME
jgi:membrane protease YdiL (CAAX protease family)